MDFVTYAFHRWDKIADYFSSLIYLFGTPKTFLVKRAPADKPDVGGSLFFLAMSYFAEVIMSLPTYKASSQSLTVALTLTLVNIIGTIPFALAIHWAWRLVGGSAAFASSFAITGYLAAVATMIIAVGALIWAGFLMVLDFPLYKLLASSVVTSASSLPFRQIILLQLSAYILWLFIGAATVWFIAAWGAYRHVHEVSRLRSAVAFAIALGLELPVFWGMLHVAIAFTRILNMPD